MAYTFTPGCNWFDSCELAYCIKNNIFFDKNRINKILEIGSFEGSSSVYFSDNLLDDPDSFMTCVDPFSDSDATTNVVDGNDTKKRFLDNISKSKNGHKVILKQQYASDFYKQNDKTYNIIYIDGSHQVPDIEIDFVNCFKILDKHGMLWLDDYLWGDGVTIRNAIDRLYTEHHTKLKVLHKNYQIGFLKMEM